MLGITRKASGHERERYGRTTPPPAGLPAFILFAILALIGWVAIPCQPLALAWVPAVGCSGDGQMGPLAAEKDDNLRFDLGTEDARELAYYKAPQTTLGVLAPRGWHCFYLYGSGG